jgi:hypothetical protein
MALKNPHKVRVKVTDPFPVVDQVEMDLRPDIVKYSDIRFNGVEYVAGPKGAKQYKVWKFEAVGSTRKHYIEVWKDSYKLYNSMWLAADGAVKMAGSKTSISFRYPWFKQFLK